MESAPAATEPHPIDAEDFPSPTFGGRALAAMCYLGFAPFAGRATVRKRDAYLDFHFKQAMSVWFVLFGIFLLYIALAFFLSYVLVYRREWYEDTWLEPTLLMIVRRAFLCWMVVWLFSAFWGLTGSWRPVPLLGRLANRAWATKTAYIWNCAVLLVAALVGAATAHASTLIRHDDRPAAAYMLYDNMGFVPWWAFNLGFYPIAIAATDKWGPDSVVVKPLTPGGLAEAVANGRFVYVLSHGTEDGLYTRKFRIRPASAAPHGTGDSLQFVYITGCDSGAQRAEWERVLAPAEVVTFNRLSAWLEHIYWLLFKGAAQIRALN